MFELWMDYLMSAKPCFFSTIALSALFSTSPVLANCPPPPRLSVNGYASDHAIGEMDLMIPISGDRLRHTYFNPAIAYGSDNQGYADIGLGHRWIHNCQTLLGVYLFGGYTRVEHDAHLWVANPGIEAMGRRWDAHLNGYLSMGDRNYHYFDGVQDSAYFFKRHSLFATEQAFNLVHHTGNGADLKFGYQLFSNVPLRGYVGGYYFHAHEVNSIGGGAVGLEYWLDDHIKSFAHYTYDNVHHSTGAIGLGIELGGTRYHRSNPCLEERLTDPVERYLAELGHGSALPGQTKYNLAGNSFTVEKIRDIAFFSQNGSPNRNGIGLTLENCTIENPCGPTDFTQVGIDTLNNLLPNTIMYFNGGSFHQVDEIVALHSGQSMYSRSEDYSSPAVGINRSVFHGRIDLSDNNLLENLIVPADLYTGEITAIKITGTDNFITGSLIGDINPVNFGTGIYLNNDFSLPISVTIENSLIRIENLISGPSALTGITASGDNLTKTTLINSEIEVIQNQTAQFSFIYGLLIQGKHSELNALNTDMSIFSALNGAPLPAFNSSTIYITTSVDSFMGEVNGGILSAEAPNASTPPEALRNASALPNPTFNGVICIINQVESSCF